MKNSERLFHAIGEADPSFIVRSERRGRRDRKSTRLNSSH